MRWIALLIAAMPLVAGAGEEFFEQKIRPVLAEKCYPCHNSKMKTAMGGLRLDTAAGLRKGGDSGPAIVPSDATKSLLLKAIGYSSLELRMPPTGKLPAEQIEALRRWIEMGAPDPRVEPTTPEPLKKAANGLEAGRQFWAFQTVHKSDPPAVKNASWVRSPIDRFLLAKLEEKGLKPAPPADRRTWIRRVTFDLIGLPPTPAEIDAYLNDQSADADGKVVERLLASPHYGERWGRHWLDLMRFAETNGHEFDNDKLDAWRYRDYVIRAFNEDVPYNQFVREHLAGDLLPGKRLSPDGAAWESPLGTNMFWFGEVLNSATDSVKQRADTVDNQIDVMSKAFLGLTVACARCHDHKFDPIPTTDYYALAGVMHSTNIREAVLDSPERVAAIEARIARIAEVNERIRKLAAKRTLALTQPAPLRPGDILFEDFEGLDYDGWSATGAAFGQAPAHRIAPNLPLRGYAGEGVGDSFGAGTDRLVGSLTSRRFKMPKLWVHIRMAGTKTAGVRVTVVADDHKSADLVPSGVPGFEWKSARMTKEIGRLCYFEIVDRSRTGHIVVDKIVLSDEEKPPAEAAMAGGPATMEETVADSGEIAALRAERAALEQDFPESAFGMLAKDEAVGNVRLHIRGSTANLGEEVPRRYLQIIAGEKQAPIQHGSGRLEIADWMASPDNPLTARVMVNRIWKHHFGQGLVRTTDNFGKMGERPSHPELLDYLAAAFVERNWSVKEMHRMMVLSSAYRMSSEEPAEAAKADPRNDLLHHMPVQRLEAEAVRDSLLAVSGRLDPTLFGPSVMPHISKYQDGRGKPKSGPLDGNGRRSIYIQVRRNFLTPMFLAFDYPLPVSAIGSRNVSTAPSQALLMLNNEFVLESARAWAQRASAAESDPTRRIERLYVEAFGRPPEDWERRETLAFVQGGDSEAWTSLCHVLFNSAEFLYVQ